MKGSLISGHHRQLDDNLVGQQTCEGGNNKEKNIKNNNTNYNKTITITNNKGERVNPSDLRTRVRTEGSNNKEMAALSKDGRPTSQDAKTEDVSTDNLNGRTGFKIRSSPRTEVEH